MRDFKLQQGTDGDELTVDMTGPDLLRFPLYNKGAGFSSTERRELGIEGLLPAQCNRIERQAERIYKSIWRAHDDVGRHIGLAMLQDRNEVLFYKVLEQHLEDVMPIVYTPTVGEASRYYSRVFRRGRGLFITPDMAGRVEEVIRRAAPFADVRLMVVTDNESILGIGDQGAGGMAISVGKLALYCAGAGIHPARTLPVSLDVGTDNEALLEDPLYLGYRERRMRGDAYLALVDEFVAAARAVFPDVVIQWEDFRKDNALLILDRFRGELPSFNDDIQGTGAVAAACVEAAAAVQQLNAGDSRILIYGAGAAGLGIARQLRVWLAGLGLEGEDLCRAVLVMDSGGIIHDARDGLDDYKAELAWNAEALDSLGLRNGEREDLCKVIRAYTPTTLIGASGQAGAFDADVIAAMADAVERPAILPMSNPTANSEAVPADLLSATNGRALVATGSPFGPVRFDGQSREVAQANNVFVFPGIGLGAIASGASAITDGMISAAAIALAGGLSDDERESGLLVPRIARLRDVCRDVAVAVAHRAREDGVAKFDDNIDARVDDCRWEPRYPRMVCTIDDR